MLQELLGYAINKFGRFYRVPEKKSSFLYNLSHELKQWLLYQKQFDYRSKNCNRNWASALVSSEMHYLPNIINYGKLSGVPFVIIYPTAVWHSSEYMDKAGLVL